MHTNRVKMHITTPVHIGDAMYIGVMKHEKGEKQ